MAVNYKRRKSNISKRNWSNYSEKENAKYMRKQLSDLGYKVPNYMKKGQISIQQIETYSKRLLNKLDKIVDKEYKESLSKSERNQYNKLNKIIVNRGGDKNNKTLINNAIEIAKELNDYSRYLNKLDVNNSELIDINRWVEKGYTSAETLLQNIHSSRLKSSNGNLSSMLEEINNLKSEEYIKDYLDRIGASDSYRKNFTKAFNKLNGGQKIYFNTRVWNEFKLKYSKEDYDEATTILGRKGYLENVLKQASKITLKEM